MNRNGSLVFDLDAYQLGEELPAVPLGRAERAVDVRTGRDIVLRRFPGDELITTLGEDGARRFVDQAHRLQGLSQPGLPRIHGARETTGELLFAFEPVSGQTVEDLLEAGVALDRPTWIAWSLRLLELLDALHGRDVLHGSLGPRSVVIQADADVALTGFGPTRLVDDPGIVEAPQISWGETPDPGADLYALGALLRKLAWSGSEPLLGSAADDPLTAALVRSQESPLRRFRSAEDMRRAFLIAVRGRAAELQPRGGESAAATQVLRRDELLESWNTLDDASAEEAGSVDGVRVASEPSEGSSRWGLWLLLLVIVALLAAAGWFYFSP